MLIDVEMYFALRKEKQLKFSFTLFSIENGQHICIPSLSGDFIVVFFPERKQIMKLVYLLNIDMLKYY